MRDSTEHHSPDGKWRVFGPGFFMNLLTNRMLANVPLAMTASLPRRAPYELNSRGVNLQSGDITTHH